MRLRILSTRLLRVDEALPERRRVVMSCERGELGAAGEDRVDVAEQPIEREVEARIRHFVEALLHLVARLGPLGAQIFARARSPFGELRPAAVDTVEDVDDDVERPLRRR